MIITIATIAVIGAIAGRSTSTAAESILSIAETVESESSHTIYGYTFVCRTNKEYRLLQNALQTLDNSAHSICTKMGWDSTARTVVKKALLEGVMLWGAYGTNISCTLIRMLQENGLEHALLSKTSDVVESCIGAMTHQKKQEFLGLYALAA